MFEGYAETWKSPNGECCLKYSDTINNDKGV